MSWFLIGLGSGLIFAYFVGSAQGYRRGQIDGFNWGQACGISVAKSVEDKARDLGLWIFGFIYDEEVERVEVRKARNPQFGERQEDRWEGTVIHKQD